MSNEIAGADFIQVWPPKTCKGCGREVFVALVRHPDTKTLKRHNFDRLPSERAGLRYYTPHRHFPTR